MTVSKLVHRCIALTLLALLTGCAGAPELLRNPFHLPAPHTNPITHAPVKPDMPALPAAGSGRGGYYLDDGPGDSPPPNLRDIPDAVVRAEPYSRYANRPYVVFGKTYTPILNEQPFVQRGVGSWYGKKFHGQKTSSGEIYDMYKMTAAHPTLPIPSYARVTNVATGKSVVVRVNDRGPFHSSRVVDLSYTAAVKLGLLERGSQNVEVERLLPNAGERLATLRRNAPEPQEPQGGALAARAEINELIVENRAEIKAIKAHPEAAREGAEAPLADALAGAPAAGDGAFYVQMGAFARADKAADIRARVAGQGWASAVDVVKSGLLHKVLSGPFATRDLALEAARSLPSTLGIKPIIVKR
jgi:rare lipoprotein A